MLDCEEVFQTELAQARAFDSSYAVDNPHINWIQVKIRSRKIISHFAQSVYDKGFFCVLKEDGSAHFALLRPTESANPHRVSKSLKLVSNKNTHRVHSLHFHPSNRILFVLLVNGNVEVWNYNLIYKVLSNSQYGLKTKDATASHAADDADAATVVGDDMDMDEPSSVTNTAPVTSVEGEGLQRICLLLCPLQNIGSSISDGTAGTYLKQLATSSVLHSLVDDKNMTLKFMINRDTVVLLSETQHSLWVFCRVSIHLSGTAINSASQSGTGFVVHSSRCLSFPEITTGDLSINNASVDKESSNRDPVVEGEIRHNLVDGCFMSGTEQIILMLFFSRRSRHIVNANAGEQNKCFERALSPLAVSVLLTPGLPSTSTGEGCTVRICGSQPLHLFNNRRGSSKSSDVVAGPVTDGLLAGLSHSASSLSLRPIVTYSCKGGAENAATSSDLERSLSVTLLFRQLYLPNSSTDTNTRSVNQRGWVISDRGVCGRWRLRPSWLESICDTSNRLCSTATQVLSDARLLFGDAAMHQDAKWTKVETGSLSNIQSGSVADNERWQLRSAALEQTKTIHVMSIAVHDKNFVSPSLDASMNTSANVYEANTGKVQLLDLYQSICAGSVNANDHGNVKNDGTNSTVLPVHRGYVDVSVGHILADGQTLREDGPELSKPEGMIRQMAAEDIACQPWLRYHLYSDSGDGNLEEEAQVTYSLAAVSRLLQSATHGLAATAAEPQLSMIGYMRRLAVLRGAYCRRVNIAKSRVRISELYQLRNPQLQRLPCVSLALLRDAPYNANQTVDKQVTTTFRDALLLRGNPNISGFECGSLLALSHGGTKLKVFLPRLQTNKPSDASKNSTLISDALQSNKTALESAATVVLECASLLEISSFIKSGVSNNLSTNPPSRVYVRLEGEGCDCLVLVTVLKPYSSNCAPSDSQADNSSASVRKNGDLDGKQRLEFFSIVSAGNDVSGVSRCGFTLQAGENLRFVRIQPTDDHSLLCGEASSAQSSSDQTGPSKATNDEKRATERRAAAMLNHCSGYFNNSTDRRAKLPKDKLVAVVTDKRLLVLCLSSLCKSSSTVSSPVLTDDTISSTDNIESDYERIVTVVYDSSSVFTSRRNSIGQFSSPGLNNTIRSCEYGQYTSNNDSTSLLDESIVQDMQEVSWLGSATLLLSLLPSTSSTFSTLTSVSSHSFLTLHLPSVQRTYGSERSAHSFSKYASSTATADASKERRNNQTSARRKLSESQWQHLDLLLRGAGISSAMSRSLLSQICRSDNDTGPARLRLLMRIPVSRDSAGDPVSLLVSVVPCLDRLISISLHTNTSSNGANCVLRVTQRPLSLLDTILYSLMNRLSTSDCRLISVGVGKNQHVGGSMAVNNSAKKWAIAMCVLAQLLSTHRRYTIQNDALGVCKDTMLMCLAPSVSSSVSETMSQFLVSLLQRPSLTASTTTSANSGGIENRGCGHWLRSRWVAYLNLLAASGMESPSSSAGISACTLIINSLSTVPTTAIKEVLNHRSGSSDGDVGYLGSWVQTIGLSPLSPSAQLLSIVARLALRVSSNLRAIEHNVGLLRLLDVAGEDLALLQILQNVQPNNSANDPANVVASLFNEWLRERMSNFRTTSESAVSTLKYLLMQPRLLQQNSQSPLWQLLRHQTNNSVLRHSVREVALTRLTVSVRVASQRSVLHALMSLLILNNTANTSDGKIGNGSVEEDVLSCMIKVIKRRIPSLRMSGSDFVRTYRNFNFDCQHFFTDNNSINQTLSLTLLEEYLSMCASLEIAVPDSSATGGLSLLSSATGLKATTARQAQQSTYFSLPQLWVPKGWEEGLYAPLSEDSMLVSRDSGDTTFDGESDETEFSQPSSAQLRQQQDRVALYCRFSDAVYNGEHIQKPTSSSESAAPGIVGQHSSPTLLAFQDLSKFETHFVELYESEPSSTGSVFSVEPSLSDVEPNDRHESAKLLCDLNYSVDFDSSSDVSGGVECGLRVSVARGSALDLALFQPDPTRSRCTVEFHLALRSVSNSNNSVRNGHNIKSQVLSTPLVLLERILQSPNNDLTNEDCLWRLSLETDGRLSFVVHSATSTQKLLSRDSVLDNLLSPNAKLDNSGNENDAADLAEQWRFSHFALRLDGSLLRYSAAQEDAGPTQGTGVKDVRVSVTGGALQVSLLVNGREVFLNSASGTNNTEAGFASLRLGDICESSLQNTLLRCLPLSRSNTATPDLRYRFTELRLWALWRDSRDLRSARNSVLPLAEKRYRLTMQLKGTKKLFRPFQPINVAMRVSGSPRTPTSNISNSQAHTSAIDAENAAVKRGTVASASGLSILPESGRVNIAPAVAVNPVGTSGMTARERRLAAARQHQQQQPQISPTEVTVDKVRSFSRDAKEIVPASDSVGAGSTMAVKTVKTSAPTGHINVPAPTVNSSASSSNAGASEQKRRRVSHLSANDLCSQVLGSGAAFGEASHTQHLSQFTVKTSSDPAPSGSSTASVFFHLHNQEGSVPTLSMDIAIPTMAHFRVLCVLPASGHAAVAAKASPTGKLVAAVQLTPHTGAKAGSTKVCVALHRCSERVLVVYEGSFILPDSTKDVQLEDGIPVTDVREVVQIPLGEVPLVFFKFIAPELLVLVKANEAFAWRAAANTNSTTNPKKNYYDPVKILIRSDYTVVSPSDSTVSSRSNDM
jgi:hypothetical protein